MGTNEQLEAMTRARAEACDAILNSDAWKRLTVAGPGTGKTFTFGHALSRALAADGREGKGLALTFINNLVTDLRRDLADVAEVYTFHGYCKHLMHRHVSGVQSADLYVSLLDLIAVDLTVTGRADTSRAAIEERLHRLAADDGVIDHALAIADYYNAVSFIDLVYRVLRHFEAARDDVPELPLVVVDEYQDFSLLETTFIDLLSTKSPVLIAGDDDQALYANFRYASPDYIRAAARGDDYATFELPYCSRCTEVVVAAVNDVIESAVRIGALADRLEKSFVCYLPDKVAESEANPNLIHVRCSTAVMPYAGQYIAQQIARIPQADITRSRAKGYPTALVIGPKPFLPRAFEVVRETVPNARMKTREDISINLLAGYERIAVDERSRLGWRIVVSCDPPEGWANLVATALDTDTDLVDHLPNDYVVRHSHLARLVGSLLNDGAIRPEDEVALCDGLTMTSGELFAALAVEGPDDALQDVEETGDAAGAAPEDSPDVLFTSLVGSKGLSAEHVFLIGLNNGHLPRDPGAITDEEICEFLVGLSRTRQRCHLISYRFLFGGPVRPRPSIFLNWIRTRLEIVDVDKDYDFTP